jgi:hypothetical protein
MKTLRTQIKDLAPTTTRTLTPDELIHVGGGGGAYPDDTFASTWTASWNCMDVVKIDGGGGAGGGSGGGGHSLM